MARTGKADIGAALTSDRSPRLVVINSSTSVGRVRQMLRLRPTLVNRIKGLAVGPMYILIEVALEKLALDLEAMEPGTLRVVDASTMDPTPDDAVAFELVPKQRGGRKAKKPDAPALRQDPKGG